VRVFDHRIPNSASFPEVIRSWEETRGAGILQGLVVERDNAVCKRLRGGLDRIFDISAYDLGSRNMLITGAAGVQIKVAASLADEERENE